MHGKIVRNAVHCLTCDTVLESVRIDDYLICHCGYDADTRISISGGTQKLELKAASNAVFNVLYEFEDDV